MAIRPHINAFDETMVTIFSADFSIDCLLNKCYLSARDVISVECSAEQLSIRINCSQHDQTSKAKENPVSDGWRKCHKLPPAEVLKSSPFSLVLREPPSSAAQGGA